MRRGLLLWAVLAAPLSAQFQLSVPEGDVEKPISSLYDFGSVPAGDVREVVFRVRNISASAASVTALSVAGTVFTLLEGPVLPKAVASGAFFEFSVRFAPPDRGLYSAVLRVNQLSPILRGIGSAAPAVFLVTQGARVQLNSTSVVDFGDVERRSSALRHIVLENPFPQSLSVATVSVAGQYFHLTPDPVLPLAIAPGGAVAFDVVFEPLATGPGAGTLIVDGLVIALRANAVEPPLPPPEIEVTPDTLASAQQGKLAVRFASAARTSGSGRATLEFRPAREGFPADPGVLFPATNGATAAFTVAEDDTAGRFGSATQIDFQTGTTAGDLVIRVELGGNTVETTIPIAAAPPVIDTARGVRSASSIELTVAGYDNTRSVSQLSFTFYDPSGSVIGSGPVRADAGADFQRYFQSSEVGGMFSLKAVFPVTGDATKIASAEVEMTNSAGTTKSSRVSF